MVSSHRVNSIGTYIISKIVVLVMKAECSSPHEIDLIATLKVQNLGKGKALGCAIPYCEMPLWLAPRPIYPA
jgi:hypothetical protein